MVLSCDCEGGLDYKIGPYDVELEAEEMKKTVQVPIVDDTDPEFIESFAVSLSVAEAFMECGIDASDARRLIRITDNDAISVEFDPVEYFVDESDGSVELTLVTSNAAVRDFVVTVQTVIGNATGSSSVVVCTGS